MLSDERKSGDGEGRLPYERPTVSWDEEMQSRPSLMSACAKLEGMSDTCNASPGVS